ncbi:hypothetical protein MVEG_06939 [Podila verticillata NRRL 6337]|nr:hypothetical protein MVEG_06939 [Podila verticillata NRRL 6337]
MGRPTGRNLEDELMTKIKLMFDRFHESDQKDNPEIPFDFTQFVDSFDDSFTTKVFEFLVKETALRYRNTQAALHHDSTRTSLNRHHHHHHFLPYHHEQGLHGQGLPGQSLERERTTRSPASAAGSPFLDTSSSLSRSLLSNQSSSGLNAGLRRSRNMPRENTTANQASSDPGSSGATSRRSSRRGDTLERQRAFILRPPPLPGTSMETLSSLEDSTVAQPFMSFADIFGPNQSTQFESDIVQRQRSQELRQQHLRQLYVQEFLARSNRRRRQAQGNPEPSPSDTRANTQPSPQARYQAHDGLLISSTQPSIADRVQEFRDSAQRARAAMRNSLNSDLVIEEDAQVLLTGEVSRRRRRPFIGATEESTGTTATQTTGTSGTTGELVSESNLEGVTEVSDMVETSLQAQGQGASGSEALEQGLASSSEAPGQGSDPASSPSQAQHHIVQPIPPTPPSPNPNRNPRPTFQDRRRSSINPADIEAVVRQLEATASSSSSSSRPFDSRLNQILESDQVDQTYISTPPPLLQAPLPSPPTADQDVDNSPR